ncbi:MAG: SUMF1/EgtB/PvdO family nonheme iron enzyme [Deltaproteobacteria bacterium]|nr:SUMF1/EgtB/PvdO family nonheme iron enzyme [Deltaproteobacteria bacterium]
MALQSEITLEGIDQAIAGLGYRNEGALKYRLVAAIREFYTEDGTPDCRQNFLGEELIRMLWDVDKDPESLKSKKKNLSSVKSSVNADLRRLYKEGRNPEGIVVGPENLFVISDEAKDDLLRSLGARIEETGTATLKEIKEVLSVLNGVLSKASLAGEIDGEQGEGGLKEIKGLLQGLVEKVGSGDLSQGMRPTKDEGFADKGAEGPLREPEMQEVLEEVEETEDEPGTLELTEEEPAEVEGMLLEEDPAEQEFLEEEPAEWDEVLPEVEETEDEPGTLELTEEEPAEIESGVLEEDPTEPEDLEVVEEPEEEFDEIEAAESDGEFLDLAEDAIPDDIPAGESEVLEGFQGCDFIEPMEEVVEDWDLDAAEVPNDIDGDETSSEVDDLVEDDPLFPVEEFMEAEGAFLDPDLFEIPGSESLGVDMDEGPPLDDVALDGGGGGAGDVLPEDDLEVIEVDENSESADRGEAQVEGGLSTSGDGEKEAGKGHGEDPGRDPPTDDPAEGIGDETGIHEENVKKARILAEEFNRSLSAMDRYYNQHLLIPGGLYTVGAGSFGGQEREERRIRLSAYYIGKFPVTNALFEIFVERTGYRTTAERCGYGTVYCGRCQRRVDERTGKETLTWNSALVSREVRGACWYQPLGPGSNLHHKRNHPVVQVSLEDALAFAAWTGKRLPTEDEWEAASRTRAGHPYPWGDAFNSEACNLELSLLGDTTRVDRYMEFENPFGIADALGNVQEWTSGRSTYPATPAEGAAYFIVKGGSWVSGPTVTLWSRVETERQSHSNILGFRTVAY